MAHNSNKTEIKVSATAHNSKNSTLTVDQKSGYCNSNSIFYSKRKPLAFPPNQDLDVTTFVSSRSHTGKIAFIDAATGRYFTFSDLWKLVASVSTSLHDDLGIRKGDVVLILSPNSIFFPVICLAVLYLGAVITTTNPLNTTREIAKQISDSKPKLAFVTASLISKLAGSHLPIVLIDAHEDDHHHSVESSQNRVATTLTEMMKKSPSQTRLGARINQDDTASLLYSSGTTGESKGVESSHKNLIAIVLTIISRLGSKNNGEQLYVCTVPMFHIYGLVTFVLGLLALGSTVVILSKFDMQGMLLTIEKYKVTYLPLVPPILVALYNNADQIKAKYDLSSLQTILSGGAPLSKEVIEGFLDKYPNVEILQGYGLTETQGAGTSTDCLEESRRYGTAGMLAPSIEAKIVDPESGKALSVNQTGELWLRGAAVMKGYFNNAEATAATITTDGWLKTGDLCYIDEDGFVFVVDRLKELIKYKGYQVAPAELEALLLTHPQIADAAVIPFPDPDVGQIPMAFVVRKGDTKPSEKEIMDFIAKQVAPYKRIRRVVYISSIPKNPSGKILRKDLVQLVTASTKL